MISNPLHDIVPAKYRRKVYALLALAALIFAAYQASEGDWATFTGSLLTTLVSLTAASNTPSPEYADYDGHGAIE